MRCHCFSTQRIPCCCGRPTPHATHQNDSEPRCRRCAYEHGGNKSYRHHNNKKHGLCIRSHSSSSSTTAPICSSREARRRRNTARAGAVRTLPDGRLTERGSEAPQPWSTCTMKPSSVIEKRGVGQRLVPSGAPQPSSSNAGSGAPQQNSTRITHPPGAATIGANGIAAGSGGVATPFSTTSRNVAWTLCRALGNAGARLSFLESMEAAVTHLCIVERLGGANRTRLHLPFLSIASATRSPCSNQGPLQRENLSKTQTAFRFRMRFPGATAQCASTTNPASSTKAISIGFAMPTVWISQHGARTSTPEKPRCPCNPRSLAPTLNANLVPSESGAR